MRNSFATERIPHYCTQSRYTPGVGVEGCTNRYQHDGKHSYEDDEEGDMPRACDDSVLCPADFHNPWCDTYRREQAQSHVLIHHDGGVTTTRPDGTTVHRGANDTVGIELGGGGRDHVAHYTVGEIETIDFIADKFDGIEYCLGNIVKYASRAKHKGQLRSDLDKIRNYAAIALELLDKQEGKTNG